MECTSICTGKIIAEAENMNSVGIAGSWRKLVLYINMTFEWNHVLNKICNGYLHFAFKLRYCISN